MLQFLNGFFSEIVWVISVTGPRAQFGRTGKRQEKIPPVFQLWHTKMPFVGPKFRGHCDIHIHIHIILYYIYTYVVKLFSGPSLALSDVVIWSKVVS